MNENSDILGLYIKENKKYPLLTEEEEQKMGKEMADLRLKITALENDTHADNSCEIENLKKKLKKIEEKFINSNLRLVYSIAKEYANKEHSLEELISEGHSGLIKAVRKFDHKKECRFSTYGTYWIKAPILKCLKKTRKKERSLNDTLGNDSKSTLADTIKDTSGNDPENVINSMARKETVNRILSKVKLTKKEKDVMLLRLGAFGKPLTLKDTGKRLGISAEQVRLIQAGAVIKLEKCPQEYKELKQALRGMG